MCKTETLTSQLNANLDVKILFGKVIHRVDPEKCSYRVCMGTKIPHSIVFLNLDAIDHNSGCNVSPQTIFTVKSNINPWTLHCHKINITNASSLGT